VAGERRQRQHLWRAAVEARDPEVVAEPAPGLILEGAAKEGDTVHVSAGKQGLTIHGALAEAA